MENCMSACSQTRREINMLHYKSFSHREALGTSSDEEVPNEKGRSVWDALD